MESKATSALATAATSARDHARAATLLGGLCGIVATLPLCFVLWPQKGFGVGELLVLAIGMLGGVAVGAVPAAGLRCLAEIADHLDRSSRS